jgi:hypothetical protein
MPAAAQAVRLEGDAVMTVGAWRRNGRVIAIGTLIVVAGWSHGLISRKAAFVEETGWAEAMPSSSSARKATSPGEGDVN